MIVGFVFIMWFWIGVLVHIVAVFVFGCILICLLGLFGRRVWVFVLWLDGICLLF